MKINLKEISGIAVDSRLVKPGFVFVAIKGALQDGHDYVAQAISNGAKIIIHQNELKNQNDVTYIQVNDPRKTLSELATEFYPSQPKYIMGITGTSGKSSIVHFIREILKLLNKKSVSIGTLGVIGDYEVKSNLTTPATIELHQIMQEIAKKDIEYVAVECSSHGIDQHRLDGLNFTSCGFTNFSRDHLDYHADMNEYFSAKLKLFSIMKSGYAVLNTDIEEFEKLYQECKNKNHRIITYGKNKNANIRITSIDRVGLYQNITWNIDGEIFITKLSLVGEFQVYNIACAIGFLIASNIDLKQLMSDLSKVASVPGRMELVEIVNDAGVFVDYAHKPEALKQALCNLRENTINKLWVVFGCGGERDQGKRQIMGQIACEYADHVIITDDNPRNEDPASIRKDILQNCNNKAIEISPREDAISYALSKISSGDTLLIAGKGHENYQIIGKDVFEFSDKDKVKELAKKYS